MGTSKISTLTLVLYTLCAAATLSFSDVGAQATDKRRSETMDRNHPPAPPNSTQIERWVAEMAAALSLTDAQKTQVLELHLAHVAKARELREQANSDRQSHRQRMDTLRKELHDEMKALLTDEQIKKLEEFMKTHGPRSGPPRQRRK